PLRWCGCDREEPGHAPSCCGVGAWFFFSSRRRHTRWPRDWSSDVCSSDLSVTVGDYVYSAAPWDEAIVSSADVVVMLTPHDEFRSEERRVGKECRGGWSPEAEKKERDVWETTHGLLATGSAHTPLQHLLLC